MFAQCKCYLWRHTWRWSIEVHFLPPPPPSTLYNQAVSPLLPTSSTTTPIYRKRRRHLLPTFKTNVRQTRLLLFSDRDRKRGRKGRKTKKYGEQQKVHYVHYKLSIVVVWESNRVMYLPFLSLLNGPTMPLLFFCPLVLSLFLNGFVWLKVLMKLEMPLRFNNGSEIWSLIYDTTACTYSSKTSSIIHKYSTTYCNMDNLLLVQCTPYYPSMYCIVWSVL